MNRIAKKRLIIVAVVAGTLATGTGGLYAWRKQRTNAHFQDLRTEGMAAAKANDYPRAVADLQQYLVRYSDDADALAEFCRVRPEVPSPDRSHLRETMNALRYYVSLRPDAIPQRRELLKLYLNYNLNTEALDTAERLLAKEPDNQELLEARAQALARLRRVPEALATVRHWAKLAPTDLRAQQMRIELMKLDHVSDAAILDDVDLLISQYPQAQSLQIVRAQALLQADRLVDARACLKEAAAAKGSPADRRAIAEMMEHAGMFDESVALLVELSSDESASGDETRTFLARRLWERGDSDAFIKLVEQHRNILDGAPDLLAIDGLLLRRVGRTAESESALVKLNADAKNPVAKAWSSVVTNVGQTMNTTIAKKQIELLSDALIDRPDDAYLLYFLGEAYAQTGDLELAVSTWQRSARAAPGWAVPPLRSSVVLASQGRYDEAFDLATAAAARSQRIALANYVQIWTSAVEAGRRTDGAELLKVIDQVMEQAPDQPWLHVSRATVLCALKRTDDAKAMITADLARFKPDQESLLRLQALSRVYKLGLEQQISDRIRADYGISADAAVTEFFRTYLSGDQGGNPTAAIASFETTRSAAKDPSSKAWLMAEARIRDFLRDAKAADAWKTLLANHGDDVDVIQAALASSSLWRDRATVDGLIEKLRGLSGDRGLSWRLHRARWLIEGSTDRAPDLAATQRASDLLTVILTTTPDAVSARYWQARCQVRLGNRASAIEQLMTASRLSPRATAITLYAAQLLQEQGDVVRARQEMDRISTQDLTDPEQNVMAAQLLAQQGKPQEAINILSQARNLDTVGEQTDLMLAMLYQRQGSYEKADAIITRLLKQPTLSAVAFAADFYRSRGKTEVAERTLQKLYELPLDPGVREMTLADYHLRSGAIAEALKFSEAATVVAPQNAAAWRGLLLAQLQAGKLDDANATLAKAAAAMPADPYITELRSAAVWPLIAEARDETFRTLALALAADPKNEAARQALTTVQAAKDRTSPAFVDSFQKLAATFPLSQPVQVVATQLLIKSGRSAEAGDLASRGIQAFPTDDALPRLAAQAMLNAGQWNSALALAKTWRQQAGTNVLPPDLLAAIASLQLGNAADAESLLRPYVAYAMDRLDEHGDVIRTFAVALYATGKDSEAQQTIEQAIARKPAFIRDWLDVVGSSLPTPIAQGWLERLEPQITDSDGVALLTRVWLQLSLRNDGGDSAKNNVRRLLASLEGRSDLSVNTALTLAVIADQTGEKATAEKLYRRAMAGDQAVPVVWNNLAMVLLSQGNLDEAERLARKATDAEPNATVFHDTYAQVLLAANKPSAAREAIDKALKLEPDNTAWRLTSAEVLAAEGKSEDAAVLAEQVAVSVAAKPSLGPQEMSRLEKLRARLTAPVTGSLDSKQIR